MASSRKPLWDVSSAEQKAIQLPEKFLCRNCNKFKPPPLFSNKEMNTGYRWKVLNKVPVNGVTAKLRCRNCSGDQMQELQCVGPCDLWKGLDDFSKNQRRQPDNAWCNTCTQWKEANEPGVTPVAPPNAILAPDEESILTYEETGFRDIEGDADTDDGGDYNAGHNDLSRYLYNKHGTSVSGTSQTSPFVDDTPPTASPAAKVARDKSSSAFGNPYDTRTDHGGNLSEVGAEELSESEDKLEWVVADRKRRVPTKPYNSWDPSGQLHRQIGSQTITSSTAASSPEPKKDFSKTWGKPGRGGDKGMTGRVQQLPQFPPVTRPIRQNHFDNDEDPDEM